MIKRITNVFGECCDIDTTTQQLCDFDNKKKIITYTANLVEDGTTTRFCTDFKERGVINDTPTKLQKWNNPVTFYYAILVDFNASKNDADKVLYNKIINYIDNHKEDFFVKNGNFRKHINLKVLKNL